MKAAVDARIAAPAPALTGLSPLALWRHGSRVERSTLLGAWFASLLLCLAFGVATVAWQWSGLPLQFGGVRVFVTLYPPLLICLWWTLCWGFWWGAVLAYTSTLTLALYAGMAPGWALLFACANPLGLAVLALGYRAITISKALRTLNAWLFYVQMSFVSSVFGSAGALIWCYALDRPPAELLPIWQGWWLGAFLQSVLIVGPLLAWSWPRIERWRAAHVWLLGRAPEGPRRLGLPLLAAIVAGVLGYGTVTIWLGSRQLHRALEAGAGLQEAALTLDATAWTFLWVFKLIVLFVCFFGYQLFTRWLGSTQSLVDALARSNAELERRSRTDGLTGLHNRMASEELLQQAWRRARRYKEPAAALMLDIDHFKTVNDRHGHAVGDAVIRALAQTLKSSLREVDVAGRWGGEEFLVVLAPADADGARTFAERLRERIAAQLVTHPGGELRYTVSIGVAVIQPEDAEAENWLKRADAALYAAKNAGRNRVELAADVV